MSQFVRDLRWAVESPSLISGTTNPDTLPSIDSHDLEAFLSQWNGHFVGYYFERLIHYWLLKIRGVDVIGQGLQIRDGTRTIGKVDFLFNDESNQLTHLETAVKFYLYLPDNDVAESSFIGPNPSDNFERKINRLFDHQLPVSRKAFPSVQKRLAIVKGRIFYHPNIARPATLPSRMFGQHLQNTWVHNNETDWFAEVHGNHAFRILRKPNRLADDLAATDTPSLMNSHQLLRWLTKHFEETDRPCLVSILKIESSAAAEVDRVFVVDNTWPRVTA